MPQNSLHTAVRVVQCCNPHPIFLLTIALHAVISHPALYFKPSDGGPTPPSLDPLLPVWARTRASVRTGSLGATVTLRTCCGLTETQPWVFTESLEEMRFELSYFYWKVDVRVAGRIPTPAATRFHGGQPAITCAPSAQRTRGFS